MLIQGRSEILTKLIKLWGEKKESKGYMHLPFSNNCYCLVILWCSVNDALCIGFNICKSLLYISELSCSSSLLFRRIFRAQ